MAETLWIIGLANKRGRKTIAFVLLAGIFLITILWSKKKVTETTEAIPFGRLMDLPPLPEGHDYMTYQAPIAPNIAGRPFQDFNKSYLYNFLPQPVKLQRDNVTDFIFVTAVSSGYNNRLTFLVHSIQQHFPSYRLIVYDLKMTKSEVKQVKRYKQVEVRKFNFSKYPEHVKELHCYAFKPIIVTEILKEGKWSGVFWLDSSLRLKTSNMSAMYEKALGSDGIAAFTGTEHSVSSVTVPEMFAYLPSVKNADTVECLLATFILIYRTETVIDNVLRWWLACALTRSCIWTYPYGGCHFTLNNRNRWAAFAKCSRYDQSALSILLYNTYADIDTILAYRVWDTAHQSSFADIVRTQFWRDVKVQTSQV